MSKLIDRRALRVISDREKIMSFFSEAKHRFLPIPEDGRIETKSFLDAASEVVPFFGE